ncbi:CAP domain-containing protein [Pelosinus sp. UFO1]|uniref:CAP domain-containing protein n=1 Tax=Pelosinus sp. UFO1 TaxID=484770 RepID=UPI0004D0FAAB|nr:CAP domain-containing protein [Pelosinus sp. UFO1]AIF53854.1 SCP-like extracellular [Pelosinus sp. UFO1]
MKNQKLFSMVTLGFLTVSLVTTSFGGIFAKAAFAAESEVSVQDEKSKDNKGLVNGALALGLIALVSSHGGSKGDVSTPSKSTTSTTGNTTTTTGNTTTTTPAATTGTAANEKLAFDLLNADRAKNGLAPLKLNSQLTKLGENYAKDMIQRNFFAHTDPDGKSPFDRMANAGISYKSAGENLAINTNVTTAETAFMNSSGHRANILNSSYTDVGVGVAYDSKGSAYVVQEFIGK